MRLPGEIPAAKWAAVGMQVAGTVYPALFVNNYLVVLNPRDGAVILADEFEMSISQLPAWTVFGEEPDEGILVFSDERGTLEMVSLRTGAALWSRQVEGVLSVLPLGTDSFMVVWKQGLQIIQADGSVVRMPKRP
jgi:hypothetical protein